MFLFGFCFAVPFATIIFCYTQLLITLKMVRQKMWRYWAQMLFWDDINFTLFWHWRSLLKIEQYRVSVCVYIFQCTSSYVSPRMKFIIKIYRPKTLSKCAATGISADVVRTPLFFNRQRRPKLSLPPPRRQSGRWPGWWSSWCWASWCAGCLTPPLPCGLWITEGNPSTWGWRPYLPAFRRPLQSTTHLSTLS